MSIPQSKKRKPDASFLPATKRQRINAPESSWIEGPSYPQCDSSPGSYSYPLQNTTTAFGSTIIPEIIPSASNNHETESGSPSEPPSPPPQPTRLTPELLPVQTPSIRLGVSDSLSQIHQNSDIHTGRGGDGTGGGTGGRGGDFNSHNITNNFHGQEFSIRDKLEISRDAPFNSDAAQTLGRRECTPNTRLNILREIISWAKDKNRPLLSSLFWIFGLAGTGKSTIAQSVCETLEKDGLLASSYFCSLQLDSRNSKHIVPSIAYHLATRYPIFKKHLASKLRDDPECAFSRISSQFRDLLCVPWGLFIKEVEAAPLQPCVIVIDALDECDNGNEVLGVILDAIDRDELPGIRFLATSRPVDALVQKALKMRRGPQIALHEVKKEEVSGDIRLFFEEQLHETVEPATIHQLTARADGLFIFASTLVKHVVPNSKFMTRSEIQEKLRQIFLPREGEKVVGLDALYNHILHDTLSLEEFGNDGFQLRLLVVQIVVCTEQATTADVIADLLDYDVKDVIGIVNSLHSVLFTRGLGEPIYVIHASFHDFIVSRAQGQFKCNLSSIHLRLSEACLGGMEEKLKFNICNIKSSFTTSDDLPAPLDSIGEPLAYACRYWWAHVQHCTQAVQEGMRQRISEMMEKKGLFWIEVMTLLEDERRCQDILTGISKASSMALEAGAERSDWELQSLALEAADMVSTFISISPKMTSHLYLSILSLWDGKHLERWLSQFQMLPRVVSRKVDGSRNTKLIVNVGSFVLSVAFSPDGKRVVSGSGQSLGSSDNSVRIWDAESGEQVAKLDGHGSEVRSVAFSPEGKRVVSGSDDNSVRIWDAESGELVAKLDGHGSSVNSVAFSPDGKRVVSGSSDTSVRMWDAESGRQVAELDGHRSSVNSVAFSPDGKRVVSGSLDKSVRIWDAESGELVAKLDGHGDSVLSVAFSLDGKRVVSGSSDTSVRMWDAESGRQIAELDGHRSPVNSVAFSPDGKRIVSGSDDNSVRMWDTKSGRQVAKLDGHGSWVNSVAFSPDGKRVVSGSWDKSVRIWDAESGEQIAKLDAHGSLVNSVAFSPDGKRVVSGSRDKNVRIWDAESGKQVAELDGHGSSVNSIAFSPDGKRVVSGSRDNSVRIWDAESGEQVAELDGHGSFVLSVAFSPDGKRVVSGSRDKNVRIWDAESGEQVAELDGHGSFVLSVAFSPDGKRVVSGSRDKNVRIWDAESSEQVAKLDGYGSWVSSVAFSPNGKRVVSGSSDNSVWIWDTESGEQLFDLENVIKSVSFRSPSNSAPPRARREQGSHPNDHHISSLAKLPMLTQTTPTDSLTLYLCPAGNSFYTREDGWIVTWKKHTGVERPLLWLPPSLRPYDPLLLTVMYTTGFNRIDMSGCTFGEGWSNIFLEKA
ncbi:mycorrhiza-induced NACHT/WD-repeat protein [Flagelloscypha sp. PMI_526]|nr:mycorrhiza-induced NACHT/WD-repeat protein [Flagelloscypha sp. PMI_526]